MLVSLHPSLFFVKNIFAHVFLRYSFLPPYRCRVITYSDIGLSAMKRNIITKFRHARSVRPNPSEVAFTMIDMEGPLLLLFLSHRFRQNGYFVRREKNPNATPLELFALLLFESPLVLTLRKLLLLLLFADRSHQLEA